MIVTREKLMGNIDKIDFFVKCRDISTIHTIYLDFV